MFRAVLFLLLLLSIGCSEKSAEPLPARRAELETLRRELAQMRTVNEDGARTLATYGRRLDALQRTVDQLHEAGKLRTLNVERVETAFLAVKEASRPGGFVLSAVDESGPALMMLDRKDRLRMRMGMRSPAQAGGQDGLACLEFYADDRATPVLSLMVSLRGEAAILTNDRQGQGKFMVYQDGAGAVNVEAVGGRRSAFHSGTGREIEQRKGQLLGSGITSESE